MSQNPRSCRAVVAFALLVALFAPALTQACQTCEYYPFPGRSAYCESVDEEETGAEVCTLTYDYWSAKYDCFESGNFCSQVTAGGGGGSGSGGTGGGGGSGSCNTTGFCAAECFSCPGGGGRPPV